MEARDIFYHSDGSVRVTRSLPPLLGKPVFELTITTEYAYGERIVYPKCKGCFPSITEEHE